MSENNPVFLGDTEAERVEDAAKKLGAYLDNNEIDRPLDTVNLTLAYLRDELGLVGDIARDGPAFQEVIRVVTSKGFRTRMSGYKRIGPETRRWGKTFRKCLWAKFDVALDTPYIPPEKTLDNQEERADTVTIERELASRIVRALEYTEQDELASSLRRLGEIV